MSAYLIHWTSRRPEELEERAQSAPGATAVSTTSRVESEAELAGFLLALPGDGTFVVTGVTEVTW